MKRFIDFRGLIQPRAGSIVGIDLSKDSLDPLNQRSSPCNIPFERSENFVLDNFNIFRYIDFQPNF